MSFLNFWEGRPGVSIVLQDLLGGAEPMTVLEQSATRSLKKWDRIAVRIVAGPDRHVISGVLLAFTAYTVELLFDGSCGAPKLKKRDAMRLTTDQLQGCTPVFTSAWLFTALPRAMLPPLGQALSRDLGRAGACIGWDVASPSRAQ
ncbi:MAG: hypothetical protein COB16_16085 [Rhodobacteraceae bacterium]|nr:MAG: hypothetical protein COB16_16085 [Paracoccaceae bacterium]